VLVLRDICQANLQCIVIGTERPLAGVMKNTALAIMQFNSLEIRISQHTNRAQQAAHEDISFAVCQQFPRNSLPPVEDGML
jgi:hypothetical protein